MLWLYSPSNMRSWLLSIAKASLVHALYNKNERALALGGTCDLECDNLEVEQNAAFKFQVKVDKHIEHKKDVERSEAPFAYLALSRSYEQVEKKK